VNQHLHKVCEFLTEIGIENSIVEGANGHLKHVDISEGKLLIQPICFPGDVLHEAGHVAIMPSRWRHLLTGDIRHAIKQMFVELDGMNLHPDDPLSRAAIQCSDPEATAWGWAAGLYLKLPKHFIINHDPLSGDYGGEGWVVAEQLEFRSYIGINGLSHAGFCCPRIPMAGKPVYPELARWLQI